jgi:hypothetical protein
MAVIPRMSPILAILDPYAFPRAIPGLPCIADSVETTISGALVPNPTMTIPIRREGMPKWRAVAAAPSTNLSELNTSTIRPPITARIGNTM